MRDFYRVESAGSKEGWKLSLIRYGLWLSKRILYRCKTLGVKLFAGGILHAVPHAVWQEPACKALEAMILGDEEWLRDRRCHLLCHAKSHWLAGTLPVECALPSSCCTHEIHHNPDLIGGTAVSNALA